MRITVIFLNYFDSSISVQLSFINQQVDVAEFEKSIDIPDQNDDFNAIREEYRTMLKNQLSKGKQWSGENQVYHFWNRSRKPEGGKTKA